MSLVYGLMLDVRCSMCTPFLSWKSHQCGWQTQSVVGQRRQSLVYIYQSAVNMSLLSSRSMCTLLFWRIFFCLKEKESLSHGYGWITIDRQTETHTHTHTHTQSQQSIHCHRPILPLTRINFKRLNWSSSSSRSPKKCYPSAIHLQWKHKVINLKGLIIQFGDL
jgi:hypothetical protein